MKWTLIHNGKLCLHEYIKISGFNYKSCVISRECISLYYKCNLLSLTSLGSCTMREQLKLPHGIPSHANETSTWEHKLTRLYLIDKNATIKVYPYHISHSRPTGHPTTGLTNSFFLIFNFELTISFVVGQWRYNQIWIDEKL